MIDLIRQELEKESPDWLKISDLSKKMYIESNIVIYNYLGIRENMINLVKVNNYSVTDVSEVLKMVYPKTNIIMVGGAYISTGYRGGITVAKAVKEINEINNETVIIVSCKEHLDKYLKDKTYLTFKCSIQKKYNLDKTDYKFIQWTNTETNIVHKFYGSEVINLARDSKLEEILG